MFKKVFEYAGPHKKDLYIATFIVLLSVLMGVLPFVLAYQVISPLVMGNAVDTKYVCIRVIGVLICLILQAILYGWGLDVSHKAAYSTLLRLRTSLQKRFEAVPLGFIQDKGTGTIKKLFVDDVDSLEVLLAHSLPEGIANLMIPIAIYVAMFFIDWKLALLSLASIPISFAAMMIMYSVGMKKMGPYYMAGQKMNNTIIEYINGMEVVKVFNKDAESYERFRKDISDYRDYTLEWYKAAWPWMAIYSSLLPCTIILTLPLGAWFVLCGFSTLPDLILVLCLSLSIGIPLLKSLSFLPTMPQLNYKIAALEQVLETAPLQQTDAVFHGKNYDICFDHITFGYEKSQPGPDGQPMVTMDEVIHDISFTAKEGQKTALVGESGSGKTTIGRAIIRIHPTAGGKILFDGKQINGRISKALDREVTQRIQMIFQDPMSSLNERAKVDYIVSEGLYAGGHHLSESERQAKVASALSDVGLLPEFASRFPHEFSGGQRQRIGIARALIMEPDFIIADEPISALDVSIRAQVLNLLSKLQKERNLTYLFIAHDLSVVRFICDRIAVIHKGKIVELAQSEELFAHPLHPYTRALLSAIPQPDPIAERQKKLIVYDPSCHHYSETNQPDWCEIVPGHFVLASEPELEEYRKQF